MSSMILTNESSRTSPVDYSGAILDNDKLVFDPYNVTGIQAHHLNKVWHTVEEEWVPWVTDLPDPGGIHYDGPGSYGDCTHYRVESIVYTYSEL